MIDISNEVILRDYLDARGVTQKEEPATIKYFTGGVSGIVAFVESEKKMMIVKQALEKLKVKADWFSDPSRMVIEKNSNEVYHRLVPEHAPAVYFYDEENYIYGREAVPEDSVMWKTDLMEGLLDFHIAEQSIQALAEVHEKCAFSEGIAETFGDNSFFENLRISPYLERVVEVYPRLNEYTAPLIHRLMNEKQTLIHGDFSPKNIMVTSRKACILDFEVAHYGHASFDLAFFANHFLLKSVWNKLLRDSFLNMLEYMMNIYFSSVRFTDAAILEKQTIELLALMLLARVDGKSPVEYLTDEVDRELVRKCAFLIVDEKPDSFNGVYEIFKNNVLEKEIK